MLKKFEEKVSNEFAKVWKDYKTLVIIGFIVFPFMIQALFKVMNIMSDYFVWGVGFSFPSDWLGFWGSYLGIIPSGLIAYAVAKYQIDTEKEREKLENDQKNLPYLTIDLNQPFCHPRQDNVFNYNIEYYIKFSSYNEFYPIRSVTVFLYMNSVDDKNYILKDSVMLGDIMPCVADFTHIKFVFDNKDTNLLDTKLVFYGRLIDGRIVKIDVDNKISSHLYMTNDKVWYSYEPEKLENSFNELEKAEIHK